MSARMPQARPVDALRADLQDAGSVIVADRRLAEALTEALGPSGPPTRTPSAWVRPEPTDPPNAGSPGRLFRALWAELSVEPKPLHRSLTRLLSAWEQTGDLTHARDQLEDPAGVLSDLTPALQAVPNRFQALQSGGPALSGPTAVVGADQLTPLEGHLVPDSSRTVPLLDEQRSVPVPAMTQWSDEHALLNGLKETLHERDPDRVAVVRSPHGPWEPRLRTALRAANIPLARPPRLRQDPYVRGFLRWLWWGLHPGRVRVRRIRPVLTAWGQQVPRERDQQFVQRTDHPAVRKLRARREVLRNQPLGASLRAFRDRSVREDTVHDQLQTLLADLELTDSPLCDVSFNRLTFYLRTYDPPVDETVRPGGVLRVDPAEALFVDRPMILFVGFGSGWLRSTPNRHAPSEPDRSRAHRHRLAYLLQCGSQQQFWTAEKNEESRPVAYHWLAGPEAPDPTPAPDSTPTGGLRPRPTEPTPDPTGGSPNADPPSLRPSAVNRWIQSERAFWLSHRLPRVRTADRTQRRLLRDGWEWLRAHPPEEASDAREAFLALGQRRLAPYCSAAEQTHVETRLSTAWARLRAHRVSVDPADPPAFVHPSDPPPNWLADAQDEARPAPREGLRVSEAPTGLDGTLGGWVHPTQLTRVSTGSATDPRTLFTRAHPELAEDQPYPNVRPFHQLALLRTLTPDEPLEYTVLYVLEEPLEPDASPSADPSVDSASLKYYPCSFAEWVRRPDAFQLLCEQAGSTTDRHKVLKRLGQTTYCQFFEQHEVPSDVREASWTDHSIRTAFRDRALDEVGDYQYVREGTDGLFAHLLRQRTRTVFREDLRSFEEWIRSIREQIRDRREDPPDRRGRPASGIAPGGDYGKLILNGQ